MNKPIPFGKYYLLERINVGGMAEVFKAKAFGVEGFERLIAVKRILPNIAEDEEFITMFIDEAKIAGQLQHANVAQIFDLGKVDDSYFIAMEYVHGKDLRAIFDHLRKLDMTMPIPHLCYTLMQVCEGLDFAHNKKDVSGRALNLVHRDVSPQNILIGYEGEVKLVDFGIAKAAGKASKTQAGILKGKFGYMSPEQVRGLPVDRRSDIFSAGICLYEMLTGERLFIGESDFSTLEKVRNVEITPPTRFNKKIPAELERIVLKALAKEPEDRYQNAIDLHDDLQAFLYSVGELCSRKDLAGWMKRSYAAEIEEDIANLEQYRQLSSPMTNDQEVQGSRGSSGAKSKGRGGGLEWDDEELETQIFDKAPGMDELQLESDEELTSADIFVGEGAGQQRSEAPTHESFPKGAPKAAPGFFEADDQTVAQSPSELLLAELENGGGATTEVQPAYQQAALVNGLPSPNGSYGSNGRGLPPPSGSLGADIFSSVGPLPNTGNAPLAQNVWGPSAAQPRASTTLPFGMPAPAQGQAPTGYQAPASYQAPPPRAALSHLGPQPKKGGLPITWIVVALLVVGAGVFAVSQMNRAGQLALQISPEDAEVLIDDQPIKGTFPQTIERNPGDYIVSVSAPGYDKVVKNIEVKAGTKEVVELKLRASPDTGFELTSEPPDRPVWLDGKPLTAGEDGSGPQIRTNFKADRVAPGKHVLEIKDNPDFKDWRYEFVQEPGRILKVQATLEPKEGGKPAEGNRPKPAAAPAPAPVAAAPKPAPAPVAAPEPAAEPEAKPEPVKPKPAPVAAAPRPVAAPKPAPAPAPAPVAAKPKPAAGGETCLITVGAKPWAKVFIDGEDTGKITPLVGHQVPCGKHKLKFVNPDLQIEKTEVITVKADQPFKKVFALVDAQE
ncbi:MAG: protein kinase [Deltaproteobacteria bacterium]|nr:protein kinase [Deltaproteobacteria bacterium]